jgi:hypothetical protein
MQINKVFKSGECEMDVWVEYNAGTNTVDSILSVGFTWCGLTVDASDMMMKYFEPCLNKLIDETDWREVACDEVINEVF